MNLLEYHSDFYEGLRYLVYELVHAFGGENQSSQ